MANVEERELLAERLITGNLYKLKHLTSKIQPEELAELINDSNNINYIKIFQVLDAEKAIKTFENLDFDKQKNLLHSFSVEQLTATLNQISPDDRTALFEKLSQETLQQYLSLLSDEERKTANQLLQYPEDSIGRLMTPDFLSVKDDWTVQQVLDYIRTYGKNTETISNVYVTDSNGFLIDDIKVREFLPMRWPRAATASRPRSSTTTAPRAPFRAGSPTWPRSRPWPIPSPPRATASSSTSRTRPATIR